MRARKGQRVFLTSGSLSNNPANVPKRTDLKIRSLPGWNAWWNQVYLLTRKRETALGGNIERGSDGDSFKVTSRSRPRPQVA